MLSGLAKHIDKAKFLVGDNSTLLLTAGGVVGTVATAYLTGKASFKAADLVAEQKNIIKTHAEEVLGEVSLSKTETAKLVWHLYLPAAGVGVLTITSIVMAHRISAKQIAALTVAAGVTERSFKEYKEKVLEQLGARQDEKIRDEVAQDRVSANPPKSGEVIIAGSGQVLCYDMLTGRYFNSTIEDLKKAENKVNYELIHYMSCSLSFFFDEIGLPPTIYSDSVGWNMNNHMELQFSATMTEDQKPCIAVNFSKLPIPDFEKHWD